MQADISFCSGTFKGVRRFLARWRRHCGLRWKDGGTDIHTLKFVIAEQTFGTVILIIIAEYKALSTMIAHLTCNYEDVCSVWCSHTLAIESGNLISGQRTVLNF